MKSPLGKNYCQNSWHLFGDALEDKAQIQKVFFGYTFRIFAMYLSSTCIYKVNNFELLLQKKHY